jgi:hypothetical protein
MKSNGQTDALLQIKLPSRILDAGWCEAQAAAGGDVSLEVRTFLVADGSDIQVDLQTTSGKNLGSFKGKVHADVHRRRVTLPQNLAENVIFQFKLPAHGLQGVSRQLRVVPGLSITDSKWFDPDGKELQVLQDGAPARGQAHIQGRPDGTPVKLSAVLIDTDGTEKVVQKSRVAIEDRSVSINLTWDYGDRALKIPENSQREREAEKYRQPVVRLECECDGIVGRGTEVPVAQELVLRYVTENGGSGPFEGKVATVEAPDGEKSDHTIPADGVVRVARTKPGPYRVVHPKLDG